MKSIISEHNGIKLDTNHGRAMKAQNILKLYHILLSHSRVEEAIPRELENISKRMKIPRMYENAWRAADTALGGKLLTSNACVRKKNGLE